MYNEKSDHILMTKFDISVSIQFPSKISVRKVTRILGTKVSV